MAHFLSFFLITERTKGIDAVVVESLSFLKIDLLRNTDDEKERIKVVYTYIVHHCTCFWTILKRLTWMILKTFELS